MSNRRVLSVGQCGADHSRISFSLKQMFGVEVISATSEDEALGRIERESFGLVLVNRIFDANGVLGIDFIKRLKGKSQTPVMLVSNFEDAQREAVEAGALPGFGKAVLGQPAMEQCLRPIFSAGEKD